MVFAGGAYLGGEHHSFLNMEAPFQHLLKCGIELRFRHLGEKSEASQMHPHGGLPHWSREAGGGKKGPVSTQGDEKITFRAQPFLLRAEFLQVQLTRHRLGQQYLYRPLFKPIRRLRGQGKRLAAMGGDYHPYGFYLHLRAFMRSRFLRASARSGSRRSAFSYATIAFSGSPLLS